MQKVDEMVKEKAILRFASVSGCFRRTLSLMPQMISMHVSRPKVVSDKASRPRLIPATMFDLNVM